MCMQNHKAKNNSSDFCNPELYVDWNRFQIFKNLYGGKKKPWKFAAMIYSAKCVIVYKSKGVPFQTWSGPRGFQEVKVPRLRDNGSGWW